MTRAADRERLWDVEAEKSRILGRGDFPQCNICRCPIGVGQAWDISHDGVPKALGGDAVGIAHRRCNRDHGAQIVAPAVAKAKRTARKHKGVLTPGMGRHRLPAGRASGIRKKISGEVVKRVSQAEMLRQTLERRRIG